MNWKVFLKGLFSAALGSAATTGAQVASNPAVIESGNYEQVGWTALAGALVGVAAYLKQSPVASKKEE